MADNVTIPATGTGTATPVVATDDVAGIHYQRVKLDGGGDGAAVPILSGGGVEASAIRVTVASDSTGVLSVDDNGSALTVDNAGTFATQVDGAALTALQLIDDVVYTDDTSTHATGTSKGALIMAAATPTDAAVTANDIGAVAMTTDRKLHVAVMDALPAGTNAIGKLAANSGADIGDVDITSIAAGDNNIGNVDIVTMPTVTVNTHAVTVASGGIASGAVASGAVASGAFASGSIASGAIAVGAIATGATSIAANEDDASANLDTGVKILATRKDTPANVSGADGDYEFLQLSAGRLWTSATIDAALPAGTNGIGKLTANSGVDIGDVDVLTLPNVTLAAGTNTNEVVGDVAQDIGVAGNPVLVGYRASTAVPAAMSADGDAVYPWANRSGALVVVQAPHLGMNADPWSQVHEGVQYTTQQTSAVIVAGGASEKLVVTSIQITATGTTSGSVQVYYGTGAFSRGTSRAIYDGHFVPSATISPGVALDGPFISGTNGDDLMITTSAAINTLTINVWYYVVV